MRNARPLALLALLSIGLAAPSADAQSAGSFTTGMGYTIEVTFNGDTLEVHEPSNGKRSVYTLEGDGRYHFTNPVNGISYTMEIRDDDTLIANKPGAPAENGTELKRMGSQGSAAPMAETESDRLMEIAQGYLARAQSDTDNTQAWSFCAFAAMARSQGGGESQLRQAAVALRQIATSSENPCSDAIPDEVWNSAE